MKILIIGLGSMGKRRAGNLISLSRVTEVRGWDPREDRRFEAEQKRGIKTYPDLDDALSWKPDAVVISTPPNYHTGYCLQMAKLKIPFFVEASVLDDGLQQVIDTMEANNSRGVPSCTMRFHPQIVQIKKLLDDGVLGELKDRIAFTYHMGQYLPDWHPDEDPTDFYVGQRETSAAREMVCFENVWLSWLLGLPTDVAGLCTKITSMKADINDTYQMVAKYQSGAKGTLLIDVVSRFPYRQLRLLSEDGVLEWSAIDQTLRTFDPNKKSWIDRGQTSQVAYAGGNFTGEEMYVREMDTFLDVAEGNVDAYPYTFAQDREILATLGAVEASGEKGIWAKVADYKK